MKSLYIVILKSLLWLVLMLFLRPFNYFLDVCLAKYSLLLETDNKIDLKKINWVAMSIFVILGVLFFVIIKLIENYG